MAVHARNQRESRLSWILDVIKTLGVDCLIVRGVATEASYPPGGYRDGHDFDLCVPDEQQFWRSYSAFIEAGMVVYGMPGIISYDRGRLVAETVLVLRPPVDTPSVNTVNIWCGRFPISSGACLDIDLFRDARPVQWRGLQFLAPSPHDTVLLIAAHGLSHWRLDFKDVNDLYAYLLAEAVDPSQTLREAKGHGLSEVLACLWAAVGEAYPGSTVPEVGTVHESARALLADVPSVDILARTSLLLRNALHTRRSRLSTVRTVADTFLNDARRRWPALATLTTVHRVPIRDRTVCPGVLITLDQVSERPSSGRLVGSTGTSEILRLRGLDLLSNVAGTFVAARGGPPSQRKVLQATEHVRSAGHAKPGMTGSVPRRR